MGKCNWPSGGGVGPDIYVKVDGADTTTGYLDSKLAVSGELTKTILLPGGNEQLKIGSTYKTRTLSLEEDWRPGETGGGGWPWFGEGNYGGTHRYRVINFQKQLVGDTGYIFTKFALPDNWDQGNVLVRIFYNRSWYGDANNLTFKIYAMAMNDADSLQPAGAPLTVNFTTSAAINQLYMSPEWAVAPNPVVAPPAMMCIKLERLNDTADCDLCLYCVRVRYGVI